MHSVPYLEMICDTRVFPAGGCLILPLLLVFCPASDADEVLHKYSSMMCVLRAEHHEGRCGYVQEFISRCCRPIAIHNKCCSRRARMNNFGNSDSSLYLQLY